MVVAAGIAVAQVLGRFGTRITNIPLLKEFIPSTLFGVGYTTGAYGGYGVTNTWDPLGIHQKRYKRGKRVQFRMPYGSYYRRNRYRRSFGRRYSSYGSRYGRSRYGYRRRSYRRSYY